MPGLSNEDAKELVRVGQELASKLPWWGDSDDEEKRSVIRCHKDVDENWHVRVHNCVGVVSVPSAQFIVEPKIPFDHFSHIVAAGLDFRWLEDSSATLGDDKSLWKLLATWYVRALERALRFEMFRDYRNVVETVPAARGSIQPLATAELFYSGRLEFQCEFDEFDVDTPLNRVLRRAAQFVGWSPLLPMELRKRALQLTNRMEGVGDMVPSDLDVETDRRTAPFRDSLSLGKQLLRWSGRALDQGTSKSWTFLVPSPQLIESGIRAILQEHFLGEHVVSNPGINVSGVPKTFDTDLVFDKNLCVADIKYKVDPTGWNRPDLYEVMAFATALETNHAAIIDFRRKTQGRFPEVTPGSMAVVELLWNSADGVSPQAAQDQFCALTAQWLAKIS